MRNLTLRRVRFSASLIAVLAAAWASVSTGSVQAQQPREDFRVEAPELPDGLTWLNSEPLSMKALKGKVVLIDFWEYTCINCIRTFPYLKAWHERYKDNGLVIIGVHTPEFHFAKKQPNVAKAAKEFGLSYPHIVDSEHLVWQTYGNRYWPAKYLIDHEGFVRYFHFGEGAYEQTEAKIQALLRAVDPKVELPPLMKPVRGADTPGAVCYPVTPELYLGYERGGFEGTLANKEGYQARKTVAYKDPGNWEDGLVYLNGDWKNEPEALVSAAATPQPKTWVAIRYHALEVNSVLRPENGKPVKAWVYHDGKPVQKKDRGADIRYDAKGRSYLLISEPRMYHIIKNAEFGQRTLKLATADAGMGIYSFTFVSCELPKKPTAAR